MDGEAAAEQDALAVFTGVPTWVTNAISRIETGDAIQPRFNEGRWPHTYAYDYVRAHAAEFGLADLLTARGGQLARADIPPALRERLGVDAGDPAYIRVVETIAYAYCRRHGIEVPDHVRKTV